VLLAVLAIASAIGIGTGGRGLWRGREPVAVRPEFKLDPSRATVDELAALPHIGPTLARRIVEARADGPFLGREDLRARVRGIGPVTLARIAPYLSIGDGKETAPSVRPTNVAVAVATANPDRASERPSPSRKPPRSRARKARGSLVALTKSGAAQASP
jgi:competence protein ComEA